MRPLYRVSLAALLLAAAAAAAQPPAEPAAPPPSPLGLEEVAIEPAAPAVETLCKLRVKVRNGGDRIASRLAFEVKLNGQALPVYARQLYLQNLPAGQVSEVRLYNFWTTESSRPAPKDGKLTVEVALKEATWVEVAMEEGVEVSRPLGPVPGLPVAKALAVQLKKAA
ncbi:MAG TPA: hypothetical protein VF121_16390 [Thermoanaerobaculia bacterium]|nr:hypothetical protein [Thermoanaerobaculia bacterium]